MKSAVINNPGDATAASMNRAMAWKALPIVLLLVYLYRTPVDQMYHIWTLGDSYYSHGFLIAPISLVLVWRKRHELISTPLSSAAWLGYPLLLFSCALIVMGAFLGFAVFTHISMIFMLSGLALIFFGWSHFRILAFPILFLIFMIPIPASLIQSIALDLKLFATNMAVSLARFMTLPIIHEGSFVYFNDEFLLIGDVCGGLRSLISMLALGALMAYMSKAKLWSRALLLLAAAPIAVASNVMRILFLCIVGYFWGAKTATGLVHDVSGVLMFVLAFMVFMGLNSFLRRLEPSQKNKGMDK